MAHITIRMPAGTSQADMARIGTALQARARYMLDNPPGSVAYSHRGAISQALHTASDKPAFVRSVMRSALLRGACFGGMLGAALSVMIYSALQGS